MTNKYTKCSQDISHSSGPREREREPLWRFTAFYRLQRQARQTLPPLSHAIARSQSEKALLPKQVALPGRGSVTGKVTPKHSQFIACRQGTGAGLGAGRSQRVQRAQRRQQETRMALSCSLHPTAPSEGSINPGGSLAFNGRRRALARRGWKGSWDTPTLPAPQICSPGCGARAGDKPEPDLHRGTVPGPGTLLWGPRTKLMAQSGGERPPRSTSGYLVS